MKFFGNANLQQNELQQAVIPLELAFPPTPKVGQIAFVNRILYICVSITNGLPVWVPLSQELTLYTHSQTTPATTWNIEHDLNTTSVQVQVFDSNDRVIIPDEIIVNTANTAIAMFNTALIGRAVVLTGHNNGIAKPTYSYIHYQTESSDSWTILHNLGREPIVRVFIGNQEVQPSSITHNSANQMTINFSTAHSGIVKLI